jgi:CHAT domain-containing protein
VEGGTAAGRTLFHRFSQYDTRSGIRRVDLDSRGRANVVVGVGHPNGSFFNAPLRLSGNANLFWLSPGGLWFGPGGQIQGASNLLLSTAPTLRIGGGEFRAAGGLGEGLGGLGNGEALDLDLEALAEGRLDGQVLGTGDGPILLAGGRLSVDRHLLLDSGAGPLTTVPASHTTLQAGRSVQLSGGNLQLQGLDIQAGTTAPEDLVRLRSGSLVGGGFGTLALSDGRLRATRVLLEGSGGLALERVEARAGGPTEPGEVQITAGTLFTTADGQLIDVNLTGGQVQVGTRGDLAIRNLRAEAGRTGGSGLLQLAASSVAKAPATLRVERASLRGSTVVLRSEGRSALRGMEAQAGGDGDQGDLLLTSRPEQGGNPGPMDIQGVNLRAGRVLLEAAGDVNATGLHIQANEISLEAKGPAGSPATLRLSGARLNGPSASGGAALPAQMVRAKTSGDLLGNDLEATGSAIVLQAAERLILGDGTVLRAEGGLAQIQLDALSSEGVTKAGKLELQSSSLVGQTIIGRSDRTLTLRGVTVNAGRPGDRGLIRLETSPSPTPQGEIDRDAGREGEMTIAETALTGGRVVLRSGTIQVADSRFHAPIGLIHLEAKQGDLQLEGSLLTVGAHSAIDDLRRPPLRFEAEGARGVIVETPSVGLYAARDLTILKNSQILASQDLREARAVEPALKREEIQLTDTSGIVVGDAQRNLLVADSTLAADASDNLAGNVILRTKGPEGSGRLALRNATLSASGGAGSGDIRLSSANGLVIEDSNLQALAPNLREDASQPGQPDATHGFIGGEITLTNSSSEKPLEIKGSRLNAAQKLGNNLLPATTMVPAPNTTSFYDANDDNDNLDTYTGGIITILSSAGIKISGANSLLKADSSEEANHYAVTNGGIIRIANISSHQIHIEAGATLSATTSLAAEKYTDPSAVKGAINLWNRGSIFIHGAQLDASISAEPNQEKLDHAASHNSITGLSEKSIVITGGSLLLNDANSKNRLALAARENVRLESVRIEPGCQESCAYPGWSEDAFNAFLKADHTKDTFWGIQQDNPNLYLVPSSNSVTDQVVSGGPYFPGEGLTGLIRSQIYREGEKLLFINGSPPLKIPLPLAAASNRVLPNAELNNVDSAPAARALTDNISWQDLGNSTLAPLSITPVLEAASNHSLLSEEISLSNTETQSIPSPAAEQLFASAQQTAGREVAAALGLARRGSNTLLISSLQQELQRALILGKSTAKVTLQTDLYNPAVLQLSIAIPPNSDTAQINQILIPSRGEVHGWQTSIQEKALRSAILDYQKTISQLSSMSQIAAGKQLSRVLVEPILPVLQRNGINALILSLDRGLQGIPFAALPVNGGVLGDFVALTVTPAIALTDLSETPPDPEPRVLLAGATRFANGLAPLPMARQELQRVADLYPHSQVLLDEGFQTNSLLTALRGRPTTILHLATHADFNVIPLSRAQIYTTDGEISLTEMQHGRDPLPRSALGLFVLNACRTALGDERQELGITGLALQAGARSALGNLWYVDDVATAAFSIQFHRSLARGMRKDKALQDTQRRFRKGEIRVKGDQIINYENEVLLEDISRAEQSKLASNLSHPYYWSGSVLSGSPW